MLIFSILLIGVALIVIESCSKRKIVQLECLTNYIHANIEKEKIKDFEKLEGVDVWRGGWERLTSEIAEEGHYIIKQCSIRQYLSENNLSLDDIEGQMFFVYSMHSYLKYDEVNPTEIHKKVDSLFFSE
jgi:hypothetical protein